MKNSKMSPKELEAESLRLHNLRQERSRIAMLAVEEMAKHPLSLEQKRKQAKRLHAEADRHYAEADRLETRQYLRERRAKSKN